MDRRGLLTGAAAAGLVIALPGPASAATGRPALEYGHEGGFVPSGWNELSPPTLVVYRDGTAIADAERRWRLRDADALVRHAEAVVRDPANGTLTLGPDDPRVADAPHTYFRTRRHRLSAYALEMYREYGGYPAVTYALLDAVEAATARVRMHGVRYRPDAVKLVAVAVDGTDPAAEIHPWPAGVAVPAFADGAWRSVEHRYGAAARAVVRGLPAGWLLYRTPSGAVLTAAYRRLLPHERGA
ncbi:hypothetical protein [Catenuloplanes atrovinosus]|uniref:Tat pathway signal sequence domain protein n=1 Tax=Catenuloplanes atrovinosus TaxID=137266 RepID=A0AAE4C793_9ACTN|nr:hypothetical protein [Catenuloplanes atrovinosus]MDR7274301.1 hypothetical protein [Catenuloplanes atrovinosus]